MTPVKLEKLHDVEVKRFLQKYKAKFMKLVSLKPFDMEKYEITIEVQHPALGQKQFYTSFEVPHPPDKRDIPSKALNAQLRVACAILHWEISCWEKWL